MMKWQSLGSAAAWCALALLASCEKQKEVAETTKFDPKFIAAEADRGNLEPLKKVNEACSAEVRTVGRRSTNCNVQDEVRRLSKPINIRF